MSNMLAFSDISGTLGAVFDVNGYVTAQFTVSGVTLSDPLAAWNGTGAAWIADRATSPTWRAFDLSGSLLGSFTGSNTNGLNKNSVACDSSGNLVISASGSTQRRSTSGTLLNSIATSGSLVAVDPSDNVLLVNGSAIAKYDTSLALVWSVTAPAFVGFRGAVCDSSGNLIISYTDSSSASHYLRKYNSSGSVVWTKTLPYFGTASSTVDLWCDGSNVYLLARDTTGPAAGDPIRLKYDSSGGLTWQDYVFWDDGYIQAKTLRGDGSLMTLAGIRGD